MARRNTRRAASGDAGGAASDDNPARPKRGHSSWRHGRGRSPWSRLLYWGFVLALWAVIVAAGAFAYVLATLPPIQSLEVPKRPPTVEIVGIDGRSLVTRGEMSGIDV